MLANPPAVSANGVLALARQGKFGAALAMGEQVLANSPRDHRLDHLVGVIACQAGVPVRGAQLLQRAAAARPGDPEIAFNLAKALADSGDSDAALALAAKSPGDARMAQLYADLLKRAGDSDQAIAAYRRRIEAAPDDAEAWNNLGTTLMAADQVDEALAAFARAHSLAPANIAVLRNQARALQLTQREDAALAVLGDAHRLAPADAGVLLDYAQTLIRLLRPVEALEVLADAARRDPGNPAVFVAIGLAYAAMAEFARSEEAYFHALAADPGNAPALLNLGVLLEQSNRIEPLRELLAGAQARGTGGDEVAMLRALVLRRDGHFAEALELVRGITGDSVDTAMVAQMEAQLADRTGATANAFAAFERMNALAAQSPVGRAFRGDEHRIFVADMAAQVTTEWVANWRPAPPPQLPSPAFLVGFPRSGTTLLDTALLGHSRTLVLEEEPVLRIIGDEAGPLASLDMLSGDRLDHLRLRYFEEVAKIAPTAGGKLVIDKMPLNILRGPLMARLFPDARIIFALRHPCDAVLSCFMQNFRINQAMASFLTLEDAARFYAASMDYWQQCRAELPLVVHEVRYEDLVEDREAVLRPLLAFLGLSWEDAVMRHEETAAGRGFIRTPSYAQVTEGIYSRARGRWERYRPQMAPVLDILAPWAIRFGYGDPRIVPPVA